MSHNIQYNTLHDYYDLKTSSSKFPPNTVVQWLAGLLHILEVPGSNVSLGTPIMTDLFRFSQFLQANAGTYLKMVYDHCSYVLSNLLFKIMLPFDTV
jgi:hypothetical protein